MGHLFSRAIKRFTQCSEGSRNQLPSGSNNTGQEQQATTGASQRDQGQDRPTVQAIPVGQSIDSAEYAAFKTAPSSISASTPQERQADDAIDEKENELVKQPKESTENELAANDQNKPEVEEAVIKIQALVRGHLTRKALKDAHQASVPQNALGQSQFDEESLRNPPNAVFSNASTANSINNNNNNNQQSNKLANNRVPPLASIAEDVESTNQSNSPRERRKLSSSINQPSGSASDTTGDSAGSQPTSPSNEANVSIDIHCDTPASASIDIMDHTSKPMPAIAAVLHHKAPVDHDPKTSSSDQLQRQQDQPQALPNNFGLHNMTNFESSVDNQRTITVSSLPSSPPHINLALTTNSHSIDSAEAAAIRIQSAFRGYHTRKHSPYRRRSPANTNSPPERLLNQINGSVTNGQPKRNTLRQQDATILDEDVDDDDDEGVEGCERLAGLADANESVNTLDCRVANTELDNEANRQSRQRHRSDEAQGDSTGQTYVKNIVSISTDEITNTDDQSTVKKLPSEESRDRQTSEADDRTVMSGSTNKTAILTGGEADEQHLGPSEQPGGRWSYNLSVGAGDDGVRWSTSIDTDSSNLGAAFSLNEDLSEDISQTSQGRSGHQPASQHRESIGGAVEGTRGSIGGLSLADDQPTSAAGDLVNQQLDELDRVTHQLEAALDEATDKEASYYGDQLAENLADRILDDESQNMNELESDDIERRDPSGLVSEDRAKTPQASESSQHPALVASNSIEDEAQQPLEVPRLDVVSPDEAIGSGESSPAPVAGGSQNGNSSEDGGADSDQDQDNQQQHQQEAGTTSTNPIGAGSNQQGGNENKARKRNRNKRKGKK